MRNSNSKIDILVASVDYSYLKNNTFQGDSSKSNLIICNQLIGEKEDFGDSFNYEERGLSKNRNKGILNARNRIGLIADDDVKFVKGFEDIIFEAYKEFPEADVISFQVVTPDGSLYKNYPNQIMWVNRYSALKISSIEITFKIDSIKKNNLAFDEMFGLGAKYTTGEETIFISDAIKRGLNVLRYPKPIVIHPKESTGSNLNSKSLAFNRGAVFARIFGFVEGLFLLFLFCVNKKRVLKSDFFLRDNLFNMIKGFFKYNKTSHKK